METVVLDFERGERFFSREIDERLIGASLRALPFMAESIRVKQKALEDIRGFTYNSISPVDILERWDELWQRAETVRRLRFLREVLVRFMKSLRASERKFLGKFYQLGLAERDVAATIGRSQSYVRYKKELLLMRAEAALLRAGITEDVFLAWFDGEALFTYWLEADEDLAEEELIDVDNEAGVEEARREAV